MPRMTQIWSLAAGLALALAATSASAQETLRVRGQIESVAGQIYSIRTRDDRLVNVRLASNAGIAASVKSALSDIAPGSFIGVAAEPQADGTLRALEAHIFHESMRGTGEGHRAWDLLPKSTMTNAVVDDIVRAVDGHAVTLKYKDGQQRILIPHGIIIVTYLPGSVAELKAGAAVFIPAATTQADGTLEAQRVMVGRDIAPPQ
jgi:hypothetical protein